MGEKYVKENRDGTTSLINPGRGEVRGRRDSKGIWHSSKQIDYQRRFNTFMLGVALAIIVALGYAAYLGLFQ